MIRDLTIAAGQIATFLGNPTVSYMKFITGGYIGEFSSAERAYWSKFFGDNNSSPYLSKETKELHKLWAHLKHLADQLVGKNSKETEVVEVPRFAVKPLFINVHLHS